MQALDNYSQFCNSFGFKKNHELYEKIPKSHIFYDNLGGHWYTKWFLCCAIEYAIVRWVGALHFSAILNIAELPEHVIERSDTATWKDISLKIYLILCWWNMKYTACAKET